MPEVIHSLQLHISHQMRYYSCLDHLTIELYLVFLGSWALGQFGVKRPKYPYVKYKVTQKEIQSLQLLISHQMRPYASAQALGGSNYIPVSQVLRYCGNLGKLGPNTPNHMQGHMKSNTKSSALCFTTNQTLLQCQGPLWVELYLFHRYLGIGQFGEIGPKYPKSCAGTHEK